MIIVTEKELNLELLAKAMNIVEAYTDFENRPINDREIMQECVNRLECARRKIIEPMELAAAVIYNIEIDTGISKIAEHLKIVMKNNGIEVRKYFDFSNYYIYKEGK